MSKQLEQTLIIFKPDAVQRGVMGEILTRFERVGLKVVGAKMLAPDTDHYYEHYETIGQMVSRRGEETFKANLEIMTKGPVLAMVLEGVEAVSLVRKMVGGTEPKSAAPGTIRGDFSHMSFAYADNKKKAIPNLIHASGDPEEAEKEIAHWFAANELYSYSQTNDIYTV